MFCSASNSVTSQSLKNFSLRVKSENDEDDEKEIKDQEFLDT